MHEDLVNQVDIAAPVLEEEAVGLFEKLQGIGCSGERQADVTYGGRHLTLGLPPLGEGDRGIVYPLIGNDLTPAMTHKGPICIKVAKQQPICRERLLEESMTTAFFLSEQIRVPRIHYMDSLGRFCIKEYIEGESITSLYMRFNSLTVRTQNLVLEGLRNFIGSLLELFKKRPDCKVSISPNNIYALTEGDRFPSPAQFVLIDPGTVLKKNYDGFSFDKYWNEVLPERIRKYQRTGYLQWIVPRHVTQSERDEAGSFDIFQGLKPAEIFLLLKIARTVEYDAEEIILQEGEMGENFYLILEGKVALRKGHFTRPDSLQTSIGSGSVLGEIGFLLRVPRSLTVVAATPCKLIEIDHDRFHEMLEANLTAPYKLIRNISKILAERLFNLDNSYQKMLECTPQLQGSEDPS
jgi:hypothetical protein